MPKVPFMIQTNHYDPELLFDLLFQYHKINYNAKNTYH